MTVTIFGGLFLPLSLFVFLFRRGWLLPLLCVAAVLQSPSVVNFQWRGEAYGVTPFMAVLALVVADLGLRVRRRGELSFGVDEQGRLLRLWLAFVAVCLVGALLLPWLFAGAQVYVPLEKDGVEAMPAALSLSISNLAQMLNLALIAVAMLWVVQQRHDACLGRRVWMGMAAALAVSTLIGLQQRLGWNGLIPLGESFWASNPTYAQNYRSWAGPVPRVSWPLVEASYGSVWYAAAFGGFATMFLADMQRNRALLGALVALFALGNSLGATGALTVLFFAGLALAAAAAAAWRHPGWRGGLVYRLALAVLVGACLWLGLHLVLRNYGLADEAMRAWNSILSRWSGTLFGSERAAADVHALNLVGETWGLGVGMGSNRGSSYLATLIGNTGLPGLLLFLVALSYQFHLLIAAWRRRNSAAAFFLGSGIAGLIAVTIAIPDQNWPVFWILVLGGLACVGEPRPGGGTAPHAAQIARDAEEHDRTV